MKKITLILALVILGFGAFAQAEDPVVVTGKITFTTSGNTQVGTPNLPIMAGTKTATAKMTIGSADGMATASIGLNLLADPTVATTVEMDDDFFTSSFGDGILVRDDFYNTDLATSTDIYVDGYVSWKSLTQLIADANALFDDQDSAEADFFEDADITGLVTIINAGTDFSQVDDATTPTAIELFVPIASDDTVDTAADPAEFLFVDSAATEINALVNTVTAYIAALVDEAVAQIMDLSTTTTAVDGTVIDTITTATGVVSFVNGLEPEDLEDLTAADVDVITEALDYVAAYQDTYSAQFTASATTTLTAASFISSATFTVLNVGGVLDMTGNMSGQNIAVGNIALDGKGHTSTSVESYPSLALSLSSGVMEGVSAGVTLYSDGELGDADANAVDAVSDTWYTWIDETAAAVETVEPKLGLKVDAGYSTSMGDMTVGANVAIGLFDLLGGDAMEFGLSLKPSFAGFGATVSGQFDMGLDMMYIGADLGYSIMGLTPSVSFINASQTGDSVIAYVADDEWASGKAAVLDTGGMVIGFGLGVDLGQFLPMAASLSANGAFAIPTGVDAILGWDASLSVTPLADLLTLTAGISDAGLYLGDAAINVLGYNAGATVSLAPLTITGGITSAYNDDANDGEAVLNWNAGVSMTHSIATIAATIASAYDTSENASYVTWAMGTTLSF